MEENDTVVHHVLHVRTLLKEENKHQNEKSNVAEGNSHYVVK